MKLAIPPDSAPLASWNRTICRMLRESGMFHVVEDGSLPRLPRAGYGRLAGNLHCMDLDGVRIAVDTWDTKAPASKAFEDGLFDRGEPLAGVKLLLKLQKWSGDDGYWDDFTWATDIPVRPWCIMPSQEWKLGCFRWQAEGHTYTGCISGVMRYGRGEYFEEAQRHPDFLTFGDHKVPFFETYLRAMQKVKFGISLHGRRNSDGKNRREIEFASCGMPLALNYQPTYPWPMTPGEDYVLLTGADDLLKLRDIDPAPYAAAADRLYQTYWSPRGMARVLVELVDELA